MTTPPPLPGLGRRPTDPARLARTARLPLTGIVPPHPPSADYLTGIGRWMIGGNRRYGTCGPTFCANSAVLTWHHLLGEDITVTDEQVFDLYRRSGNPTFDPATGDGDNGVDMTVMLAELVRAGMDITHADGTTERVKPLCFAAHDTGIDMVRAVTAIFGFDGFGLDLQVAQQAQTSGGLWDFEPGSPGWGGHATLGGSYTGSPTGADETNITWAEPVAMTDAFLAHQLPEAYVVVWPALWDHPAFAEGVDRAALAAAYRQATGRPFPLPPSPPGGDIHIDVADRALLAALPDGWVTGRHTGPNRGAAGAVRRWEIDKGLASR